MIWPPAMVKHNPGMKSVGILLFDGVEVLDFAGPYEVFATSKRSDMSFVFSVKTIGLNSPITATGGLRVLPDLLLSEAASPDILIVPGGKGTRPLFATGELDEFLKNCESKMIASVCTGSILLGRAGLLDGLPATTHFGAMNYLDQLPEVRVERGKRWTESDRIWTSAGVSAGIDMSLRLVAHLEGDEVAGLTAKGMEYPYPPENRR